MTEQMKQMTQEELIALAKKQDPKDRVPCIIRDDLPFEGTPTHVHTKRARDVFNLRPGETLHEALERKAAEGVA